jgi:hypothetical protein
MTFQPTSTKTELLESITGEWDNLQTALDGLSEEQMLLPGVVESWSIKDVVAHITFWQVRLVTAMFKAEKGFKPDTISGGGGMDKLNQQNYLDQKDRDFEAIWEDFESSYQQILNRLENWSEDMLFKPKHFDWMKGSPFARYVEGDSAEHYAEHAEHIKAWRKLKGF